MLNCQQVGPDHKFCCERLVQKFTNFCKIKNINQLEGVFSLSKVLVILTNKLDSGYLTEQGPVRSDLLTGAATMWDWLNFI